MPVALEEQVLKYLIEAPEAGDTVEGIAEWWLLEQNIRSALDEVRQALDVLVAGGWLEVSSSHGGTRYRLNRERLAAARVRVASSSQRR